MSWSIALGAICVPIMVRKYQEMSEYTEYVRNRILDEAVFLVDGSKLHRLLMRIIVDSARKRLAVRLDSVLERAESRISKSGF